MDAVEFVDLIRSRFYFKDLYHFTDRSNLESIKEFGLLSKARLDELGISPLNPGGDEQSRNSDREHGIYNFVSLSFTPRNPMAYTCRQDGRHPNQVMISVCPSVLLLPNTLICSEMANTTGARFHPVSEALEDLDYEVWLKDHGLKFADIKERVDKMSRVEVLVCTQVPRNKLLSCRSSS
ncbi:DUF4433 domain-containing protein [Phaeobacter sp. JL2872]|uniref:DarT ssDNA thymidine ADP-ribosyltransferase family protein n=1 Tax=Phaeobacter gallaeciensis TaxID=60890 RepID=UPI0009F4AD69|nr:DUF4433 domain-containing protein [Phaeobacter sp. JL2872]